MHTDKLPCPKVMGLLAQHFEKQRERFPDMVLSDRGITFCDNDECSSASELDDLVAHESDP